MNLQKIKEKYLEVLTLENWLCFSIFFLPFYLIKIKVFYLPTNFWEIAIAIGFLWWFLGKKDSWKNIWLKYKRYLLPLLFIFLGLSTSTIMNENYRVGLGIIKGWFIFPLIFFFLSAETLKEEKIKRLFHFFYFSALTVAIIALAYWFLGELTFDFRLKAFFNSPNYLAMYLSPAVIIGGVLFKENKYFYVISLILILGALFFTFSFAAWAAVIMASSIVFFFLIKNKKKKIFFIGILLLVFISFCFLLTKNQKAKELFSFSDRSSLASRLMIWKTAGNLIQDNFLWGIGPGNFQNKYLEYQRFYPPYLEWAVPHPHNLFLAFWLYSGIFGLAGFLVLLGIFFYEFFKKQKSALSFMALGIILIIIFHGFLDTTYFKNDLAVIFWLAFLGLAKELRQKTKA